MNQNQQAFQDFYPDELSHCYGCGRLNEQGLQLKSYWDGEETVAHARMWHFWGTKDQWERVRLAREEYERLAHVPRTSPVTQECAYLVGLWHHRKPSERLQNVWRFMPDGRVSVTHPTISGTWWHDSALQAVFIRWDGGWGGEMFHLPPFQAPAFRPIHGRSLKRGHLTPQDEFTLKRRN